MRLPQIHEGGLRMESHLTEAAGRIVRPQYRQTYHSGRNHNAGLSSTVICTRQLALSVAMHPPSIPVALSVDLREV